MEHRPLGFYIADSTFSGGDELEGIVGAYPGSAYQLDALVNIQGPTGGSPGAFGGAAIMNTTSGQTMLFGMRWSGGAWQPYVMAYNSPTSFNASLYSGGDLAPNFFFSTFMLSIPDWRPRIPSRFS